MKIRTTTRMRTPIGSIITHRSPGGTESHERTGLLGIWNIIRGVKEAQKQVKDEIEKKRANDERKQKRANNEAKRVAEQKRLESLFTDNSMIIKSPRTRKFLGDGDWMKSPGGVPAPVAYFNVENGGNGMTKVHGRILKVLRKALDKEPISSFNVRELNGDATYNKTVSPYTPVDHRGRWRAWGTNREELEDATKKRQRTLSMPMSREKELPEYALKALKDVKALRKIRGLMRGERFNSKKPMRLHPWLNIHHRYRKPVSSKNMKDLGKYKIPSAAAIYRREGINVVGQVLSIPQPPNGRRMQNKQLCLRKVKNRNQPYFAPLGTCRFE